MVAYALVWTFAVLAFLCFVSPLAASPAAAREEAERDAPSHAPQFLLARKS
jgi:hypothetical protein